MSYDLELKNIIQQVSGIDNVFWGIAPKDMKYPLIVLNLVSEQHDYSQDGLDSISRSTVQIDVWTTTHGQTISLANSIKPIFNHYAFDSDGAIKAAMIVNTRQNIDELGKPTLFGFSIDARIFHE